MMGYKAWLSVGVSVHLKGVGWVEFRVQFLFYSRLRKPFLYRFGIDMLKKERVVTKWLP